MRAGLGLTAGAAAAAGGSYALIESSVLPGKYRLAQLLGACGSPPPPPRRPLPGWRQTIFWSAYRRRTVQMVTLLPAGIRSARGLGVVIGLHGLGGGAAVMARQAAAAMAISGVRGLAVITVDGGSTYWHRRADGDDPLGMIIHEVLPRAAAGGLATGRIAMIGYSMGGYGALLLAERLGEGPAPARRGAGRDTPASGSVRDRAVNTPAATAVAALSPAVFTSYADARAADPGAFDGPEDFRRNDILSGLPALRSTATWISVRQR